MEILKLSIIFSLAITCFCVNTCPDESVIPDCKCRQTRELNALPDIICTGEEVDVSKIIQSLNEHANGEVQHFGTLVWENGVKVGLGDNFFGNITFRVLQIGSPMRYCHVSSVSSKAFNGPIADEVVSLSVRAIELGGEEPLFESIAELKNLEYLAIEGRYLTHVPTDAFNCDLKETCDLSKLKRINFTEGTYETFIFLTTIQERAFYNLPSLEEINMSTQDVMFIGDYAFASPVPVESKLKIGLSRQWSREFKPESFSLYSLAELNRPVELDLWGNQFIKYLPEAVFKPFFDAHPDNTVRLGMKMNCSCEMHWLYAEPEKYQKHFIDWYYWDTLDDNATRYVHCAEDVELWDMKPEQFEQCKLTPLDSGETIEKDEL